MSYFPFLWANTQDSPSSFPAIWLDLLNRHIRLQEKHQWETLQFKSSFHINIGAFYTQFKWYFILCGDLSWLYTPTKNTLTCFLSSSNLPFSMDLDLLGSHSERCLAVVKQREWWTWQWRHLPRTTALTESERRRCRRQWREGGKEEGRRSAWWEKHTTRQQTCRDYHL